MIVLATPWPATRQALLGLGVHHHTIPWDKLTYDKELEGYRTDVTEAQVQGAPAFYGATVLCLVIAAKIIGVGISGWLSQQLRLFLFGVEPWDPPVMAIVTLVLATAGLAATILPARRAASIDPMVALRDR